MISFHKMNEDGEIVETRFIRQDAITKCPHLIMVPEHYRDNGTCRCDDPDHTEMLEWEYVWNGKAWL